MMPIRPRYRWFFLLMVALLALCVILPLIGTSPHGLLLTSTNVRGESLEAVTMVASASTSASATVLRQPGQPVAISWWGAPGQAIAVLPPTLLPPVLEQGTTAGDGNHVLFWSTAPGVTHVVVSYSTDGGVVWKHAAAPVGMPWTAVKLEGTATLPPTQGVEVIARSYAGVGTPTLPPPIIP